MNLPNQLTSARLALTLVFVAVLAIPIPHRFTIGLGLFILASFTDFLDGYFARKYNLITTFGKLMDPLADKILMCSAFVVLCAERNLVPAWVVVVILSREFLVTGIRLVATSQGAILAADSMGKLKTVFQISTVIYFLLFLSSTEISFGFLAPIFSWLLLSPLVLGNALIGLSLLTTLFSGLNYLRKNSHLLQDC